MAFSPDGANLALATGTMFDARLPQIVLWSIPSGEEAARFQTSAIQNVISVAYNLTGTQIAITGTNNAISIFDIRTNELIQEIRLDGMPREATFLNADQSLMVVVDDSGASDIHIINVNTGTLVNEFNNVFISPQFAVSRLRDFVLVSEKVENDAILYNTLDGREIARITIRESQRVSVEAAYIALNVTEDRFAFGIERSLYIIGSATDNLVPFDISLPPLPTVIESVPTPLPTLTLLDPTVTQTIDIFAVADVGTTTATVETTLVPSTTPTNIYVGEPPSLIFGQIVSGTLGSGEEVPWTFVGIEGDSVVITLTGNFDTFLTLNSPENYELISDDDSLSNANSQIRDYILPADGLYIIRVSGYAGAGGTYQLELQRTQTMNVVPLVPLEQTSVESLRQAAENPTRTAYLDRTDYYSFDDNQYPQLDPDTQAIAFNADQGVVITLDVFAGDPSSLAFEFRLYTPGFELLTVEPQTTLTLPETGTYLALIRRLQRSEFQYYVFSLAIVGYDGSSVDSRDEPPQLSGTLAVYGSSIEIQTNETLQGEIGGRYLWRFNGTAGDVVSIGVETSGEMVIMLYNAVGTQILAVDNDSILPTQIVGYTLPYTGFYYVLVEVQAWVRAGLYLLNISSGNEVAFTYPDEMVLNYGDVIITDNENQKLWFFDGDAGDVVFINATVLTDDIRDYLVSEHRLIAPDGRVLNPMVDFDRSPVFEAYVLPLNGRYQLSAGASGLYQLQISLTPPNLIEYGESVETVTTTPQDKYFWTFAANEGEIVIINGFENYDENTSRELQVYAPDGQILGIDGLTGRGPSNSLQIGPVAILQSGIYTIWRRSDQENFGVSLRQFTVSDERQIEYGETVVAISDNTPAHWTFSAQSGDIIGLHASSTEDELQVELLSPQGQALYDGVGDAPLESVDNSITSTNIASWASTVLPTFLTLAESGVYEIVVQPGNAVLYSLTLVGESDLGEVTAFDYAALQTPMPTQIASTEFITAENVFDVIAVATIRPQTDAIGTYVSGIRGSTTGFISSEVFATADGSLWNVVTAQIVGRWRPDDGTVGEISVSSSGRLIAYQTQTNIEIWTSNGQKIRDIYGEYPRYSSAAFSHDDGRIAVERTNTEVYVIELSTGATIMSVPVNNREVRSLAFSPDNGVLAINADDVFVYDTQTWRRLARFETNSHSRLAKDLFAFSPNGRLLAYLDLEEIRVVSTDDWIQQLALPVDFPMTLAFNFDGTMLVSSNVSNELYFWSSQNGQLISVSTAENASDLVFSPDGEYLVLVSINYSNVNYVSIRKVVEP